MPADSRLRRTAKRILAPLLTDNAYSRLQALAMAWDIRTGNWTEPELKFAQSLVGPGDTVIDIGANYGLYSYWLSRAVGSTGTVHAFEPIPFTAATFQRVQSLLRMRGVQLHKVGCAESAAELEFQIPINRSGSMSAGVAHLATRKRGPRTEVFADFKKLHCPVVAIDDHLADLENLSLIKCDVEGAELFALRGAQHLIQRYHPAILCEVDREFLGGHGLAPEDVFAFLESFGYRGFHVVDGALRQGTADEAVAENWIFMHPSRTIQAANDASSSIRVEGAR